MTQGRSVARNVFGEPLAECCSKPLTGFYRTGSCETGPEDFGIHTVCARVDADFLAFSRAAGNDLSTPVPAAGFSRIAAGRLLVPVRRALERGFRGRPGAKGAADRDA